MRFEQALELMKQGKKVKLPSWGGYWYWDEEKQTVMVERPAKKGALFNETQPRM